MRCPPMSASGTRFSCCPPGSSSGGSSHDDLIDLIIPRGSNELVRSIKESTKIPV